jgi:hypothetical protein
VRLTETKGPADVILPCRMGASTPHRRTDRMRRVRCSRVGYDAEVVREAGPARRAALNEVRGRIAGMVAGRDVPIGIVARSGSLGVDSAHERKEGEEELFPPVEDSHPERF